MEKTHCKICGNKYGSFQSVRWGKPTTIKKWLCDSFKCKTHNPYNPTKEYDLYRIKACKIMNEHPDKIKILKECLCEERKKIKHHPNYNKPFEVELLCYSCHWEAHEKIEPGFNSNDKNGWFSHAMAIKKAHPER